MCSDDASRFAGTLTVQCGRQGTHQLEREFTVDGPLEMSLVVEYAEAPDQGHVAVLTEDEFIAMLPAGR